MGYIELSDAGYSRRIGVPELQGTIRIELGGDGEPRLVVPESMPVERPADTEPPRVSQG